MWRVSSCKVFWSFSDGKTKDMIMDSIIELILSVIWSLTPSLLQGCARHWNDVECVTTDTEYIKIGF